MKINNYQSRMAYSTHIWQLGLLAIQNVIWVLYCQMISRDTSPAIWITIPVNSNTFQSRCVLVLYQIPYQYATSQDASLARLPTFGGDRCAHFPTVYYGCVVVNSRSPRPPQVLHCSQRQCSQQFCHCRCPSSSSCSQQLRNCYQSRRSPHLRDPASWRSRRQLFRLPQWMRTHC